MNSSAHNGKKKKKHTPLSPTFPDHCIYEGSDRGVKVSEHVSPSSSIKPVAWECRSKSFVQRFHHDFAGGPMDKSLPANAEGMGSNPGPGRSPTCRGATKRVHRNY